MKTKSAALLITCFIFLPLLIGGCAKSEEAGQVASSALQTESTAIMDGEFFNEDRAGEATAISRPAASAADAPVEQKTAGDTMTAPGRESKKPSDGRSQPAAFPGRPELPNFEVARDRLLEYQIFLTFSSEDPLKSRSDLYAIVSKYGYLTSANTDSDPRLIVNARFRVKVEDLHRVIDELKTLGRLENEAISLTDHTEQMVWQARVARRETIRSARRARAPETAKTWAQKESLIAASEDARDQAEHEQWKIRDRVAWANFSVDLRGPESPREIEVPRFGNAFTGMLNLLLLLLYGMIYLAPFLALVLGGVYGYRTWKRRRAAP